ncbi:MAG: endonuclease NucS [Candidatus Thorarchaeota archaeon]
MNQEHLEEFLKTYRGTDGSLLYWPKIQVMSINDETSVTINYEHLMKFDSQILQDNSDPQRFLETLDSALISILRLEDPNYINSLDASHIHVHIIRHPNTLIPSWLKPRMIGQLMTVKGFVTDASGVKPLLKQGMFLCRLCQTEIPQPQEHGLPTEPVICPVCTKKTSMKLIDSKSDFIEFQSCRIQDTEPPIGTIPAHLDAFLEKDLAGQALQGETVSLTGLLRALPRKDPQATYEYYLEVVGVERHGRANHIGTKPQIKIEEDLEELLQRKPDLLGYDFRALDRQVKTKTGRIDLLMEAPDTGIVVVELKVDKGDRNAVGQIQEYMTWVEQKYGPRRKVRGIIVANGFSERMISSLKGSKYHIRLVDLSTIVSLGGEESGSD